MSVAPSLGPWAWEMLPASFRGLPFAVRESRIHRGRRTALHEYPYRDDVWVEDLGLGTRSIRFRGFLVGDDVFDQRDALSAAMDQPGPGTLVHPSLGTVECVNVEFSAGETAERGRVVELELAFIEAAQDLALYPAIEIATQAQTLLLAIAADAACVADFIADTEAAAAIGEDVLTAGLSIAGGWAALATAAMSDGALIAHVVDGLPGIQAGRYASGNLVVPQPPGTTITTAIDALTVARATVAADVSALGLATATTLPTAAQQVSTDVLAAAIEPADQIRLLSSMATYSPTVATSLAPIGGAIATMQVATAAVCRRASLTALARATAGYQPTSYNDAATVLYAVTTLLDGEIVVAADAGDDQTYLALRALRTAVATDLITRGSALPQLMTVTRPAPLPSLLLAYQLYQDATRSDELIARADPIHPAFMPVSFQALSS